MSPGEQRGGIGRIFRAEATGKRPSPVFQHRRRRRGRGRRRTRHRAQPSRARNTGEVQAATVRDCATSRRADHLDMGCVVLEVDAGRHRHQRPAGHKQAEFSLTQVLDRPVSGRVFFEHVIRDNLDAGRPDQVSLIFDRRLKRSGPRATPGRFRTRVITEGVTPSLHIDYKHCAIKQYHKEGRALRTETTINDTRDFRIGKRLTNLPALREIGLSANRRLLGAQRLSHNPIRAAEAFTAVHEPIITDTGHAHRRATPRRPPRPRAAASTADVPAAPERIPQPRPARPAGRTARPRHDQRRADELRPTTATRPRADHPHPAQPPLPAHRHRAAPRHAAQPRPHPAAATRPGPTHRPRPARTQHRCAPPPATTSAPSINSPRRPDSPHDHQT